MFVVWAPGGAHLICEVEFSRLIVKRADCSPFVPRGARMTSGVALVLDAGTLTRRDRAPR